MRTRFAALLGSAVFALAACGGGGTPAQEDPQAPLKIGASPTPHAEVLEFVKDNLAEDAGLDFEIEQFDDYNRPNDALQHGELDANYYQHKPFLEKYESERGGEFSWVTDVHSEPLGVHSKKVDDLQDLQQGATVTVPNDPANQARALKLLQAEGVLKLEPGTGQNAGVRDVAENPKKLELKPLAADQLPRTVQDAAAAVVNGNYAIKAGLEDPIAVEDVKNDPYVNGLVSTPQMKDDPRVRKLAELLTSQQVKDFINEKWGAAVEPAA
ncbi:MetQ/NlpA family ABC transporter substrate-binding protein [Salinifilum aidingensis]